MRKLLFTFALIELACAARADTLILRNGSAVRGTYMGDTSQTFRMEVNGNVQTFALKDVQGLTIGSDTVTTTATSSAVAKTPQLTSPTAAVNGTIASGSILTIRLIDAIDSATSQAGDTFRASLDEPIMEGTDTLVARGANAVVKLVAEKEANKISGRPELTLELVSIRFGDRDVPVRSQSFTQAGASRTTRSAEVIGGGTALGAIIGAVAGGGKGAAIGALSGAGAGTAVQVLTKGAKVQIPSETRLSFTLQEAIYL